MITGDVSIPCKEKHRGGEARKVKEGEKIGGKGQQRGEERGV